jgi:hypothetical protein
MNKEFSIRFGAYKLLPSVRDAIEFIFPFSVVESIYRGSPEEALKTTNHRIKVAITGTLHACWGLDDQSLIKVLFEHGKRQIIQKLKDGSLTDAQEYTLSTSNSPHRSPFDPTKISEPVGAEVHVTIENTDLANNLNELQVGTLIVDAMDNINARFHDLHGQDLFVATEFRATLDLIRPASSRDEFTVRVITLAHIIDHLNLNLLRKITGVTDSKFASISLLEQYLKSIKGDYSLVIKTFRNLVYLRNGYPVHTDKDGRVIDAHKYFAIKYFPSDFREAWLTLLKGFLKALDLLKSSFDQK